MAIFPETGVLRSDPLDCEFGDAILASEWEDKMVAFDHLPSEFWYTLYDPGDDSEDNKRRCELYGHLAFLPTSAVIDGVKTNLFRRFDEDAHQAHVEDQYPDKDVETTSLPNEEKLPE